MGKHIVKVSNEKQMYLKETTRLQRENKKLLYRDTKEDELDAQVKQLTKHLKIANKSTTKYKKRFKDLRMQLDNRRDAGIGFEVRSKRDRGIGRPRKNDTNIYVSDESSSEDEQIIM